MWVEVNMALGDFTVVKRRDWDVDPENGGGQNIYVDVDGGDQSLTMQFDTVDDLRLFVQRLTYLAEPAFEHHRELAIRRNGALWRPGPT